MNRRGNRLGTFALAAAALLGWGTYDVWHNVAFGDCAFGCLEGLDKICDDGGNEWIVHAGDKPAGEIWDPRADPNQETGGLYYWKEYKRYFNCDSCPCDRDPACDYPCIGTGSNCTDWESLSAGFYNRCVGS